MLFVEPYFGEKSLKGYLSCFSPHYHPPLNQHGFSVDAKKGFAVLPSVITPTVPFRHSPWLFRQAIR